MADAARGPATAPVPCPPELPPPGTPPQAPVPDAAGAAPPGCGNTPAPQCPRHAPQDGARQRDARRYAEEAERQQDA